MGTTILVVRRNGKVVIAGDGQVTIGNEVLKAGANKLRRLHKDTIPRRLRRFHRGRFFAVLPIESKLEQFNGTWPAARSRWRRTGGPIKCWRHLEALLLVADLTNTYISAATAT